MKRVINFSGGKSSAYMTISNYNPLTDIVIFTDTGREHPATYKFINDFEAFENIPIIRLGGKDSFSNMLSKRNYEALPNAKMRFCTVHLKIKKCRKYCKSKLGMKYTSLIGFRYDEKNRINKYINKFKGVNTIFPLNDNYITKEFINEYWRNKPYTLNIPSILGNCTLCFNKGPAAIIAILRQYPEFANEWIQDENLSKLKYGNTYIKNNPIEKLLQISKIPDLFSNIDLSNINPIHNCACSI